MRYLIPFLLVPVLLGLAALRSTSASATAGPLAQEPAHAVVERAEAVLPRWSGALEAADREAVDLTLEVWAAPLAVAEVAAAGTYVEAGDRIARLETRGLGLALEAAQAAVDAGQAELRAARVRTQRSAATSERQLAAAHSQAARSAAALEDWRARGRALEERRVELETRRRADELQDLQDALSALEARYRDAPPADAAAQAELARARRDLARGRAEVELATEQRARFESVELPEIEAKLEAEAARTAESLATLEALAPVEGEARAAQLTQLEREVARSVEERAGLQRDLEALELRALQAGVVTHRVPLQVGDTLSPGATPLELAAPDRFAIELELGQAEASDALVGRAVRVTLSGEDTPLAGVVEAVGPSQEPSRAGAPGRRVRVLLSGALPGRRAGQAASVELLPVAGSEPPARFRIPAAALVDAQGAPFVWLALDVAGDYRRVPVQLEDRGALEVTVRGPLEAGARVLVAGQ